MAARHNEPTTENKSTQNTKAILATTEPSNLTRVCLIETVTTRFLPTMTSTAAGSSFPSARPPWFSAFGKQKNRFQSSNIFWALWSDSANDRPVRDPDIPYGANNTETNQIRSTHIYWEIIAFSPLHQ